MEASPESLFESDSSDLEELVASLISIKKRCYLPRIPYVSAIVSEPGIVNQRTPCFPQQLKHSAKTCLRSVDCHFKVNGHVWKQNIVTCFGFFLQGIQWICDFIVILYCSRVVEAILSLESLDSNQKVVVCPNDQGQDKMASQISCFTGFKNCAGFIDGTLLPLKDKQMIEPQDYHLQKGIHNTCLWENSDLHLQEGKLFSPGQYLLADSGFLTESNLVLAFKKPPHRQITCFQKKFNQCLDSLRVCNKHCIGILKGQFQLLQGLRLELTLVKSMERITQWVGACVILNNYLLNGKTPSISVGAESLITEKPKPD
ncbi:hypothetical protein VP01_941g16 [Puccinia sorghi]|uniref:DDE Tnp4 domain-containing protein n=1 Tax=Puccinia sorghi TaxID=27349 RepID=A0A0L6U6Q7_9BASI|nr:hypothetical protein VP01_941g16 [Puccinia sorghi]